MYKIDGNETEYNLCKQGIQNDSLPHINKVINFTIVQYICKKKKYLSIYLINVNLGVRYLWIVK